MVLGQSHICHTRRRSMTNFSNNYNSTRCPHLLEWKASIEMKTATQIKIMQVVTNLH